jgi:two-component system sensor histidine kinase KdpD
LVVPGGVAEELAGGGVDDADVEVFDQDQDVFLPFQRLDDSSRSGIGLGLALSRGLVEAMGGTLEPEETPGGGLTMVVSLPAVQERT